MSWTKGNHELVRAHHHREHPERWGHHRDQRHHRRPACDSFDRLHPSDRDGNQHGLHYDQRNRRGQQHSSNQTQVDSLPAPPDLAPYALASDLAAAERLIAANASSVTALNTSLTTGLAGKANQSALDTMQLEVDGKSTPASVDAKLASYSTTAAITSAITSANNATLASVASNYALRTVTDQLALDLAAKQTGLDVDTKIANALLDRPSTADLTAAVSLKTTPADVDLRVTTALLTYVSQVALDAALALRDGRLDAAEASIATLQAAGFQTAAQVASAIATSLLPYTDTAGLNSLLAVRDGRLDSAEASVAALQAAGFQTSAQVASAIATALLPCKRGWTRRWRSGTPGWTATTPTSSPCRPRAPLPRPPT